MKRLFCLILTLSMLFACISVFPAQKATANEDEPSEKISWFVAGMTVGEAKATSKAIKYVKHPGCDPLGDDELISTGDIVVTDNGSYMAWVLGDVAGDGGQGVYSYILIKRNYMGTYGFNEMEAFTADINRDGSVDQYDYILAKRIYFNTFEIEKPTNSDGVPVLLYHHILPDEIKDTDKWRGNNITISTSEFRRHMQMLTDGGYNVVTAEEVVRYVRGEILLPDKSLMLCFDDGYKSNTYYAAPILREFGFQATVFAIISGYMGSYQEEFDSDTLQKITPEDLLPNADVIDQQCHTYANHNHLPEQSYEQVYNDLVIAQNSYHCDYFAYPYGDNSATVIDAVRDAGFKAAFSTVERNAVPGDYIFLIPRYTVISPMKDSDYLKLIAKAD